MQAGSPVPRSTQGSHTKVTHTLPDYKVLKGHSCLSTRGAGSHPGSPRCGPPLLAVPGFMARPLAFSPPPPPDRPSPPVWTSSFSSRSPSVTCRVGRLLARWPWSPWVQRVVIFKTRVSL